LIGFCAQFCTIELIISHPSLLFSNRGQFSIINEAIATSEIVGTFDNGTFAMFPKCPLIFRIRVLSG
jgi:hypothetical protein